MPKKIHRKLLALTNNQFFSNFDTLYGEIDVDDEMSSHLLTEASPPAVTDVHLKWYNDADTETATYADTDRAQTLTPT